MTETRLGPEKVGPFLQQQAEELTRIWRLARATARPNVFPGLVDDLVMPFFVRAGELLAAGEAPEDVWGGLAGVVRWPPPLAPDELTQEWAVLVEVVAAACESVNADPPVADWLARAIETCDAGSTALAGGRGAGPSGILTALVFSSLTPRHQPAEQDETTS